MAASKSMEIWVGGKYRLSKKIGEGAFGEIFTANDVTTNQNVAVKLVKYLLS